MKTFDELSLSPAVAKAITEMGYTTPSPIQAQALPILLGAPTDFIGLAATGTGKTAAFSIPMLEQIDASIKAVQTLILCPTRELALQVAGQINMLGKHKGIRALPVYGGASYSEQLQGMKSGMQVVVGTPGRVVDHIERGTLKLGNLKQLILDEADEMISMGFKDELDKILSSVDREQARIWLFSATMSSDVRRVADKYLTNPQQVQSNKKEMLSATVDQLYYVTRESNKPEILCKLIEAAEDFYGVIFCQTKSLVADLSQYLVDRGYKVDCLHGDKDQRSREKTMQSFRDRRVTVLICTDVASRGLDVKDITHVINYSLPRELDSYVHRIGRTARSGKTGIAMSLVTPSHMGILRRIETMTKTRMREGVIPSRRDIGTKKISSMLAKFVGEKSGTRAVEVMDTSWKEALGQMTGEEVAGRFLAMMNPDIFSEAERFDMPGPRMSADGDRESGPRRYDRRGGDRRSSGPSNRRGNDERSSSRPTRRASGDSDSGPTRRPSPVEGAESSRPTRRPSSDVDTRPARRASSEESTRPSRAPSAERSERPFRARTERSVSVGSDRAPAEGGQRPPRGVTYGRMPKRFTENSTNPHARSTFRDRTPNRATE